jgi:tetratricopeptide (TPR) repeat protein
MRSYIALFVSLALAGCVSSTAHLNSVSIGMTKPEVIQAMGQPTSTRGSSNVEYLMYHLASQPWIARAAAYKQGVTGYGEDEYYVRLINGRVDAYGEQGDFDSTHIPEQKLDVDVNMRGTPVIQQSPQPEQPTGFDLAMQAGGINLSNKDYQAASASFQQATAMRPSSQQAWTGLGMAYGMLHEFPLALYAARKSVDLDPSQPLPLASLACIYAALGDTNKYVETLERVRQMDPAMAEGAAEFVREEAKKAENSK